MGGASQWGGCHAGGAGGCDGPAAAQAAQRPPAAARARGCRGGPSAAGVARRPQVFGGAWRPRADGNTLATSGPSWTGLQLEKAVFWALACNVCATLT